jgi:hypothetical protein
MKLITQLAEDLTILKPLTAIRRRSTILYVTVMDPADKRVMWISEVIRDEYRTMYQQGPVYSSSSRKTEYE